MKTNLIRALSISVSLALGACAARVGELESGDRPYDDEDTELGASEAALNTSTPYVGIIPAGDLAAPGVASCPDGTNGTLVGIRMDDEDSGNNDQLTVGSQNYSGHNASVGGLIHSSSPRRAGGNSWIKYCPRYMPSLPALSHDYAVLSASNVCPQGSYRFSRRFDNEDSSNHNETVGDISPHSSDTNGGATWLHFCFVRAQSGAPSWSSEFDNSLIFTNGPVANKGAFRTDDEDSDNHNSYSVPAPGAGYTSRMQALVSSGSNTTLQFGTNAAFDVVDLGTGAGCADSNYKIGFKCRFGTNGQFQGCAPVGGLDDWWAFTKDMFCRW
jgi:hypothetical protein